MKIPSWLVHASSVLLLLWIIGGNVVDISGTTLLLGASKQTLLVIVYVGILSVAALAAWTGALQHLNKRTDLSVGRRSTWRIMLYLGFVFTGLLYVVTNMWAPALLRGRQNRSSSH